MQKIFNDTITSISKKTTGRVYSKGKLKFEGFEVMKNSPNLASTASTFLLDDIPGDLNRISRVEHLLRVIEVRSVEIRQSVVDVSVKCVIGAIFQCVNQSGDEIGCKGNDEAL
jgi:hypothetical protein